MISQRIQITANSCCSWREELNNKVRWQSLYEHVTTNFLCRSALMERRENGLPTLHPLTLNENQHQTKLVNVNH